MRFKTTMKNQTYQPQGCGLSTITSGFSVSGKIRDENGSSHRTAWILLELPSQDEINQDITTLVEAGWSWDQIFDMEVGDKHSRITVNQLHERAEAVRKGVKTPEPDLATAD